MRVRVWPEAVVAFIPFLIKVEYTGDPRITWFCNTVEICEAFNVEAADAIAMKAALEGAKRVRPLTVLRVVARPGPAAVTAPTSAVRPAAAAVPVTFPGTL